MIKRIRSSLFAKVFMITAVLMAVCCSITYFCITQFAPYIYTHDLSAIDEELPYLVEEISRYTKEEVLYILEDYSDRIMEENDDEFVFQFFQSDSEELGQFDKNDTSRWCRLTFVDSPEEYIVFFSKNTEKESQIAFALQKAIPVLSVVILAVSIIASFFYTVYMTTPIKRISKISKQMAALDFSGLCAVRRMDEIGILADSLNDLSGKLSSALSELQSANKQLQADIDKERELERQRMDFFSAASHELKTPVTIIKGQLQGMLYQVGRYKDRETYLAESLAVTDTLEKMVQELLTISRLDTPGYVCDKEELDLSSLIKECLLAHEDLFMQRELAVEILISPAVLVLGDVRLLQKALDNLLGNAAAYSPAGNHIFVKLWQNDNKAELTIENTGVYIPDEDIPKLFEAFYRVDQSRNRQTGGTGLGLYIVKTILDLHGAEIKIENTSQGVIVSVQF
ncbi:MAG: HAMP domain-containing histidine kinase [Lachnoclostridium sp.]|nr:HAMP domain-containing histidine kinase [Lachnoclostridium sp.]